MSLFDDIPLPDGAELEALNRRNEADAKRERAMPVKAALRSLGNALRTLDAEQATELFKGIAKAERAHRRELSRKAKETRAQNDAGHPGIFIELAQPIDFEKNSPLMTEADREWLREVATHITGGWLGIGYECERGYNSINVRGDCRDTAIANWNKWELGAPASVKSRQWAVEVYVPNEPTRRFRFWGPCSVDPAEVLATAGARRKVVRP